jgi:polyisoprenoid-binding protein YceI
VNKTPVQLILSIVLLMSVSSVQAAPAKAKAASVKTPAASAAVVKPAAPVKKGQDFTVGGGSLEFFAIGKPSMLKIHGESAQMTGVLNRDGDQVTGDLEIPLASFETGMKVRNDHLKEKVFETSKFEKAKLTIVTLTLPTGKTGELKDLPFTGKLALHGVEKDVSGTATFTVSDKTLGFEAQLDVKMSDFQMPPPEFMGMTIQDQVKVNAKGEAKAQI